MNIFFIILTIALFLPVIAHIWAFNRVTFKILTPWISLNDLDINLSPRELRLLEWKLYVKKRNTVGLRVSSDAYIELKMLFSHAAYYGPYDESRIFTTPIDIVYGSAKVNKLRDYINAGIKSHKFVLVGVKQRKSQYVLPKMQPDDELVKDIQEKQELMGAYIEKVFNKIEEHPKKIFPVYFMERGSELDDISKNLFGNKDKTEEEIELKRKIEYLYSMKSTFEI